MTRTWKADPGWTGDWKMPALLQRPVTDRERAILVSLSRAGFGPMRLVKMLERAEEIGELWDEHPSRGRAVMNDLAQLGARAIVPSDDEYPGELAEIEAAPPVLYVRGDPLDAMTPRVAIVGARACTSGAARFAHRLGEAFAYSGYTVVSGLARGVDAAAHHGALEEGRTIAVLGTGIDVCYPPEHRGLAERIVKSGAIVCEFPPTIGPRAWHFPARNRIVSGLSAAVVVVEAGVSSGALITVDFAIKHGRQVLACTTGPENPAGAGVRDLLKEGATLIVDAEQAVEVMNDVMSEQGFAFGRPLVRDLADPGADLSGDLRMVYDLAADDADLDDIARRAELDPASVARLLGRLELDGILECTNGRWRAKSHRG